MIKVPFDLLYPFVGSYKLTVHEHGDRCINFTICRRWIRVFDQQRSTVVR